MSGNRLSRHLLRPLMGLLAAGALGACTAYGTVPGDGQRSWQQARNMAYRSPAPAIAGLPEAPVPTAKGMRYKVRPGDTLTNLAARNDVTIATLAIANRLDPPYALRAGQTIVLPKGRPAMTVADLIPVPQPRPAGKKAPTAGQSAVVATAITAGDDADDAASVVWPVKGSIAEGFGARPSGSRNDGINIRAPAGTPVLAAASGFVVYAGTGIEGMGELVLVRHAGGYTTAYAHNTKLAVKAGDRVRAGQKIARVGQTGSVASPQLHFELRSGDEPIDPLPVLEKGALPLVTS